MSRPLSAVASRPLLPVVGEGRSLFLPGGPTRAVDLDVAATAPCLTAVADAVTALLPWYGSVHRGAGAGASITTAAFEQARAEVASFVGARADDQVIFTRNTTEALNLLAAALPRDTTVVTSAAEHHANLLPWRDRPHVVLPPPRSADEALAQTDAALAAAKTRHRVLAVTGASNVTGELFPIDALVAVARRRGARVVVDAAQLAPHRAIDLRALGVDWVAFSGHKLYAPFGAGALVGRADWLDVAEPWLAGGGATRRVTETRTEWAAGPARHEAGTPAVLGAVALGAACQALRRVGFDAIVGHERALVRRLLDGLWSLPRVRVLSLFPPGSARVGVAAFVVEGHAPSEVAARLAEEHGVAVRAGAFCAHRLVDALLAGSAHSGAVRASVGVHTRAEDVERLLEGLRAIVSRRASRTAVDAPCRAQKQGAYRPL